MRVIPITKGYEVLVDDEDFELLSIRRWYAVETASAVYAARRKTVARGVSKIVMMHREILHARPDVLVDHRDHNGLNNQKSNLRVCTSSQNAANSRKQRRETTSQFKGVSFVPSVNRTNPWLAYIDQEQRRRYLGYFGSELEAAEAYDRAARQTFGEFAYLNSEESYETNRR